MMRIFLILTCCILFLATTYSQVTYPVNGVRTEAHTSYAITNASIFLDYSTKIEKATLVIRDGKIFDVGVNVSVPADAIIIDGTGKTIYPSFIDAFSNYGLPEVKRKQSNREPQFLSSTKGAYSWNEAIKPEFNAVNEFAAPSAKPLRELGFGSVHSFNPDGIARGTGCVVALADLNENELILLEKASQNFSFDKGSSTQDYPSSLMGSIALLRQTYYDARWYKSGKPSETNLSLQALNENSGLPQIFEVSNKWSALRADKVGDEFGIQYILVGKGDEYQRIDEIKATGATFIIPLNFPKPFQVADAYDTRNLSTADLKHWELAPGNAAALAKAGITFCITASGLDANTFLKNLRLAVQSGLSETQALKALTENPARILKINDRTGALKKGMLANFLICSGNLFSSDAIIYQNWVLGNKYEINEMDLPDTRGTYNLEISAQKFQLILKGNISSPSATIVSANDTMKAQFSKKGDFYQLSFSDSTKQSYRFTGWYNSSQKMFSGNGENQIGQKLKWNATQVKPFEVEDKKEKSTATIEVGNLTYPFTDYGFKTLPKLEITLIRNTTVWTNEPEGKLLNTDVLLEGGKIKVIGKNLTAANATIIDGTGKHLTAGIIDEHSHIAISQGVNEGTQSVTSEVRIGDVLNPEDVNIYRQLAGGVTASHLLHGSANTIGGQTQLIKLRWGSNAEQLKFSGWDPFIKFALGENVKQANWGESQTVRFPQTRMGVEQVLYDAFWKAKEYKAAWNNFNTNNTSIIPRKDLELEALVEILNKKRFITCHSYVQSEINMLMHVADSMGFTVNTFTHILEGFKVADKMKKHGANASSFADWWAYKYEVYDASPYNPYILTRMGINTAINSDDAEMARRLNQEASKSIKYGGLSEEEALKMCTLNPAIMLHVDNRVGSIKVGKDADVVLWSANPLSIYAKAEKTFVDGILYYDIELDKRLRKEIAEERARLIQKMATSLKNGETPKQGGSEPDELWECESLPYDAWKNDDNR